MKTRVYFNTTDTPVNIDGDGRTLGGGEWAPMERNDQIRKALELGQLVETEPNEDLIDGSTDGAKAHKAAIEANAEKDAETADNDAKRDTAGTEEVESPSEVKTKSKSRKSGEKQER